MSGDVSYDMLVSLTLMKSLKMNLHFDDRITYGDINLALGKKENYLQMSLIGSFQVIEKHYLNVVCTSEHPPPVKFLSVPFKLKNDTPITRPDKKKNDVVPQSC